MPDPQPGDADPVDNQILWPRLNFGSHLPHNRRFWDRHLRSLKAFLTHYRCTIDALSTHYRRTSGPTCIIVPPAHHWRYFFSSPLCFVHQTQAYIFFFHFSHLFLWVVCRYIPGKLSQIRLWLISHQPPFFSLSSTVYSSKSTFASAYSSVSFHYILSVFPPLQISNLTFCRCAIISA